MSLHRWLQFRLPTLLVAVAAVCVLLVANTRPSEPVSLGHVSSDDPRIRPGLWIMGSEFGWPWTWRRESFKDGIFNVTVFDGIQWRGLSGNMAAGALIVAVTVVFMEFVLRGATRWRRTNVGGDSP